MSYDNPKTAGTKSAARSSRDKSTPSESAGASSPELSDAELQKVSGGTKGSTNLLLACASGKHIPKPTL
jgi:hypothetical protein